MEVYDSSRFAEELVRGFNLKKVLIDGDSWVSHPFPNVTNISHQLDILNRDILILNYANPGDEALEILRPKGKRYKKLKQILKDRAWKQDFDLIFLSMGGNDIVGPEIIKKRFVKNKKTNPNLHGHELISKHYYNMLSKIINKYKAFIEMKNSAGFNSKTPIVTHTYGYLLPRKIGTTFLSIKFNEGWVKVYLDKLHITDEREQYLVIKGMLDSFADRLHALEKECENFHVIDTRKILTGADGKPDLRCWHDEIHPNKNGFKKITQHINTEIKQYLT